MDKKELIRKLKEFSGEDYLVCIDDGTGWWNIKSVQKEEEVIILTMDKYPRRSKKKTSLLSRLKNLLIKISD